MESEISPLVKSGVLLPSDASGKNTPAAPSSSYAQHKARNYPAQGQSLPLPSNQDFMKTKKLGNTVAFMLIAAFTFSPILAYAKQGKGSDHENKGRKEIAGQVRFSDDDDEDEDREERKERMERNVNGKRHNLRERECLRAFGLLISRSHRKDRLEEMRDRVCFWPFGIRKKVSTTTPPSLDTTAPVIGSIVARSKVFKAEVMWETSERTRSTIYFGTTTPLNLASASTRLAGRSDHSKTHFVELTSLTASTTYYAVISATDLAGNIATSSEFSFRTKSAPPDSVAPVIIGVAALVSTTTVSVRWQTNEFATGRLFYGTTTPLDANASTTPFIEDASLVKVHRLDLGGLTASTTYYFIVESKDASSNIKRTSQFQAMTLVN